MLLLLLLLSLLLLLLLVLLFMVVVCYCIWMYVLHITPCCIVLCLLSPSLLYLFSALFHFTLAFSLFLSRSFFIILLFLSFSLLRCSFFSCGCSTNRFGSVLFICLFDLSIFFFFFCCWCCCCRKLIALFLYTSTWL